MRPRIVRIVFAKELREMLRDRRSMVVMFGIPIVLYPLLALAISSLSSSRLTEMKSTAYGVAVINGQAAPILVDRLGRPELFRPRPGQSPDEQRKAAARPDVGLKVQSVADPDAALAAGQIEAIIEVPADAQKRAIAGEDLATQVRVDRSRTSTAIVEQKIRDAFYAYEQWVIQQRLAAHDVPPEVLSEVRYTTHDVSTGQARLGRHLWQMLPLLLLITGMVGALFPALHATTAERELGTLETLLVSPATRMELLVAKGGLVLLSSLLTAAINMVSMSLVLWHVLANLQQQSQDVQISIGSLALSFLAAVPGLIFFATVVLIVGLVARNFREANAFVTPVMLLPMAAVAISIIEPDSTPGLLVTPVANTTIIIRDVLLGRATWPPFLLAFASSCVYAGLMLSVAVRLFSNEQLVNPAWEPLSVRGLRLGRRGGAQQRPRRLPTVDEAIALCAVALLLVFYIDPLIITRKSLGEWALPAVVVVNQVLLFGVPTVLLAWFGRYRWRQTFSLRAVGLAPLAAAVLLALGLSPFVDLISGIQFRLWPGDLDTQKRMFELFEPWLRNDPVVIALLVGVLAGVFEELMFRGPIQASMVKRLPPWMAIAVAAFLFAAIHFDLRLLPIRWGLGILLGWIVWRGGSIYPAMLLHGVYDAGKLLVASWKLRQEGPDMLLGEALPPLLTRQSLIELSIGAALLVIGFVLLVRSWRETPERQTEATVEPAVTAAK